MDYATHYAQEEASQARHGRFQVYRFCETANHIPSDVGSLLDVGCGEGHWLDWLSRHRRSLDRLVGVEVAANRVEAARSRYPRLDIKAGDVFEMDLERRFEVVTCLEVIEHLTDWHAAVERLMEIATRKVVITVPYREKIPSEVCLHCHKMTPRYGHLHSFDESSFDVFKSRHPVTTGVIWGEDEVVWLRHLYYRTLAPPSWLVAVIHMDGSPDNPTALRRLVRGVRARALGFVPRRILT
jgi:trans-aconitate methyltransferase